MGSSFFEGKTRRVISVVFKVPSEKIFTEPGVRVMTSLVISVVSSYVPNRSGSSVRVGTSVSSSSRGTLSTLDPSRPVSTQDPESIRKDVLI